MKLIKSSKACQKKEKLDIKAQTPFKVKASIKIGGLAGELFNK